jgi:protein SCO1/2
MPTPTDLPPRQSPPRQSHRGFMLVMVGLFFGVLLLGAAATMWLGGSSPIGPAIGGPFALTDANGQRFTDKDLKGSYTLVYFGYTFCPDVCPTTLNQVAEALDRLGSKAERIRPVFITIDPARDTPAVMKQYVSAFSPRLVGLTGSDAEIGAVAKEYRVYYAPHRTGDGPGDYTMDHSSVLYLLGPDGRFIAPIRADDSAEQIAAQLSKQIQ